MCYAPTFDSKAQDNYDDSCMVTTDSFKEISLQQANILHLRLGNLSLKYSKVLCSNIDINFFKDSLICIICLAVKQVENIFLHAL